MYFKRIFGLAILPVLSIVFLFSCSPHDTTGNTSHGSSKYVQSISGSPQFQAAISENSLVLVDFYAEWCPPCKELRPTIEKLAEDYQASLKVISVDVDANNELAKKYAITSIPDVRLFANGKEVKSWVGLRAYEEFDNVIKAHQ